MSISDIKTEVQFQYQSTACTTKTDNAYIVIEATHTWVYI